MLSRMPVHTKRWNDPVEPHDGMRVLICRYRPRGVLRANEPWDAWTTALAPSVSLHAGAYGKDGQPRLPFAEYARRFREEMASADFWLQGFARNVARGETLTLLCSSACLDEATCHRSIVKTLIEEAARAQLEPRDRATMPTRRRGAP
jgi:uncharacterized protein YeaO (DUF488 family)